MPEALLAYVAVAALLTVTPGADMALVLRSTLRSGRRAAAWTTLGICSGLLVHALASAVGLSLVLARSATAFSVVKALGAAYLVYLGARTLWESRRAAPARPDEAAAPVDARPGAAFATGLVSNVLNPKVALFYLTFLPQFVAPGDPVLATTVALALVHVAMGLAWLLAYAWMLDAGKAWVTRAGVRAWIERATGAVLVLFGARLALSARS